SDVNDILYSAPVKIHLVGVSNLKIASAYPNPVSVNAATTVQYSVGEAQSLTVSAYNAAGQEITVIASGHHNKGEYSVDFSAAGLTPGIYFIRLASEQSS